MVELINWVMNDLDSFDAEDYDPVFAKRIIRLTHNLGLELTSVEMEP